MVVHDCACVCGQEKGKLVPMCRDSVTFYQ